MGETKNKKVVRKKLIGFDSEMLKGLEDKMESMKASNETEVLRRLLVGEKHFSPVVERIISERQKDFECSRDEVIQLLIIEALQIKDPNFRLLKGTPKKK